jgi:hypothetical protein
MMNEDNACMSKMYVQQTETIVLYVLRCAAIAVAYQNPVWSVTSLEALHYVS